MLPDLVTCPTCGAANATDAGWCGQCYAALGEPSSAPAVSSGPAAATDKPIAPAADRGEPMAANARTAESPEWTCARCDGANPMSAAVCGHCGSEIYASFGDPEPARDTTLTPQSLLVPGLALGRVGSQIEGVTVGFLVLAAFGFAVALRSRIVIAAILVTFGIVLWALSIHDAQRTAAGDRGAIVLRLPVLKGVVFASIVGIALLMLVVLSSVQDVP